MKGSTSWRRFAQAIGLCLGLAGVAAADVGGGRGKPDSPYIQGGRPETLASVNDVRKQNAEQRFVNFTLPSGSHVFGHRVRVAYARGEKWEKADAAFVGRVDGESVDRRIDFAVVQDVAVTDRNATSATLKLTLFPDISAEELLKKQPSYLTLKKDYARTVTLRVALRSPSGGDLALTGEERRSSFDTIPPKAKVLALFKDLPPGQRFELAAASFDHRWWWAIKSVASDPAYPHRLVTAD